MVTLKPKAITIVEVITVMAIVAVTLTLFAGKLSSMSEDARVKEAAVQLEALQTGLKSYFLSKGGYPQDKFDSDISKFVVMKGGSGSSPGIDWNGKTPVGGSWDFSSTQGNDNNFGILLADVTINPDSMKLLDALVDDGDLNGGSFYKRSGNDYEMLISGTSRSGVPLDAGKGSGDTETINGLPVSSNSP